jgi:hypothetical protein
MRRDSRGIADIVEAAELISEFLASETQADFDSDKRRGVRSSTSIPCIDMCDRRFRLSIRENGNEA